ncbi:MAG: MlaE family lipid ABC transporter permease subunit [Desulfomonilaceae bacterium]|nr:MlaE family lipid ABC transporter permease subunit [Desulfomonilaceae bacterium]
MSEKEEHLDAPAAAQSSGEPVIRSADDSAKGYTVHAEDWHFDEVRVYVSGTVSMDNAEHVRRDLVRAVTAQPMKNVLIDLSKVEYFDSSGAAILLDIFRVTDELHTSLRLVNVPERIRSLRDFADLDRHIESGILQPRPEPNLLIQIGEGMLQLHRNTVDILTFIGAAVEALIHDVARPGKLKWDRLWKLVDKAGSDAVPIVTLLSFLMGCILAFQAAVQLRKFGANIFVADLVSVSICLEMGPLLTALIVAGRSGAAYAAQIGTMQVTEEVDALRVMGIDPIRYLVSPRILAVALALPCLTLIADLAGILGGCLVAAFSLDITPVGYFNQVHKVLEFTDVMKGLIKSFVFGIEIAMIGCLRGFQVRGGAESVGAATTSAVVTSIFILTVTDAVFAVLFYYGPSF